jgi:hypothetical protein
LDERNFLRENSRFELKNTESMKAVLAQEPKAVFILIGNHDQPLMDIVLGRRIAVELGSQTHVTLTRKSVYPVAPSSKHGDVVFVVDDQPNANPIAESVHLLSKHISKPENKLVSLSVFPEGMLPYTGGQMPMTVKEGAFVIARRLAVHLQTEGIPVFLVQFQSNILEHLTIEQSIPATANLEFIERVPVVPMEKGRPDRWVELRRLGAENSFNQGRAVSQIDLFHPHNPSGSNVPLRASNHKCKSALQ